MTETATPRVDPGSPAPPGTEREVGGAFVAVLAFCGIAVSVMQTLVVPLLTELPQLLHTTTSNASWVVTSTLLAGAVATPVMGRLGDMYGKRRMLLIALGMLVAGSLTCALTSSLVPMVVGRAIQGGAVGAIPLGISIMRDELPPQKLGSAMALMSSSLGIGGAFGLPAAAFVAQHADWHALFFGSAGLGALCIALVLLVVPESSVRAPGRFDFVGAIGLSAGLVALLLPITKGADWGWSSGTTLGLFGASAVILLVWGFLELRISAPLVDLRTTARRQVLLTNVTSILVGFSFYALSLVLPQLLQLPKATGYGLGQSMVMAGLYVAPMGVAMMVVSPLSARINTTYGPKVSLLAGLVVIGATYGAGLGMMDAVWQVVVLSTALGVGVGIAYSAMPTLIISAVPAAETGAANGLNTLMRSIGMSTSSAVVGVILAHNTTTLGPVAVPNLDGFRTSFAVACGTAAAGALVAMFLPSRKGAAGAGGRAAGGRAPTKAGDSASDAEGEPAGAPSGTGAVHTDLTLDAASLSGSVVHGRVLGPGGTGLSGAAVTLIDTTGHQRGRAICARDGYYTLHAPEAGSFVLIGSAPGHEPLALTVPVREAPIGCDLRLCSRGGGLTGIVRTAAGVPLPGALVTVTDAEGEVAASATADPGGGYTVSGLVPGAYTLTVSATAHRPHAGRVEAVQGVPLRVDAELRPAAEVRGTVRNRAGAPVGAARVSLLDTAGDVVGHFLTDETGEYGFADLTGERYTVVASGYPPATAAVSVGAGTAVREVDFLLSHG
ncbi:transporter [Streptomyces albus subsp. albus]|nr:transporter [Streptomyces albus subsp. albus]